jgi:limonene-1,2-epoxide hydrolase
VGADTSDSAGSRGEKESEGTERLALLRAFGERLAAGDAEGAAALFTPDVAYDEPPAHTFHGRDALRAFIADFAATHSDVRFEVVRALASRDGATLAAEWRWSYTRTADGARRAFAGMCFVDVRDGQMATWKGYSVPVSPSADMLP